MRLATLAAVLVSGFLSSGCLVIGLHPFYDDGSIEFDEALIGEWESGEESLRIARSPWKSYRIDYTSGAETASYDGHLTRLGSFKLLDLVPVTEGAIRVHLPVRVKPLGDTLSLAPLDFWWFRREAEHGQPQALRPAIDDEGDVLLTAATAAVRDWLAAHAEHFDDDPVRFTRKPAR
ncbi:MAG TPA: hypothetical protein PKK95_01775 [Vicinamibacterales bacterium]|nr:hypothetical protein [Acidobacteriota bacterium]HOC16961.1 hypothetical protein [Vicinamibacterales bacterium]